MSFLLEFSLHIDFLTNCFLTPTTKDKNRRGKTRWPKAKLCQIYAVSFTVPLRQGFKRAGNLFSGVVKFERYLVSGAAAGGTEGTGPVNASVCLVYLSVCLVAAFRFWGLIQVNVSGVLRATSGILVVAGACAVFSCIHVHIYAVCCMCECACKKRKKKGLITPFLVVCIVLGFIVQNWEKKQ